MRLRAVAPVLVLVLIAQLLAVGMADAGAACSDSSQSSSDWPVFGHDLSNTRTQPSPGKLTPEHAPALAPKWILDAAAAGVKGQFESTPIISYGCVFMATNVGHVVALDADTGALVWHSVLAGGVTTLAADGGRIFADVSIPNAPELDALDATSGAIIWKRTLDTIRGSDTTGSPTVYDGMVLTGVSGVTAEVASGADRLVYRGAFVIVDQASGEIVAKDYVIPDAAFAKGYAGGGIWGTPAVDASTGYAYVGSGNPFSAEEHPRTNAMLKIDVDRSRPTFGKIVDSFKGNVDHYFPAANWRKPLCAATNSGFVECEFLDDDFGSSPNLFTVDGKTIVGDLQKSGIYWALRADTMEYEWGTTVTSPMGFASNAASPAFDGTRIIVSAGTQPDTLTSLNPEFGSIDWISPVTAGSNYHSPAITNGVVYDDAKGFLTAYDARTGSILLKRSIAQDVGARFVWVGLHSTGLAIAHDVVFAAADHYLVAYA